MLISTYIIARLVTVSGSCEGWTWTRSRAPLKQAMAEGQRTRSKGLGKGQDIRQQDMRQQDIEGARTCGGEPGFADTLLVRDACLCLHAQRAARALARRFDAAFRPFGLTNGQFSLLMAINQPQPPGIGVLASILASDRTTLTAALKPLQRRGLVDSLADPADRRSRRLRLTPAGLALLADALPVWRAIHAQVEAELERHGASAPALREALGIVVERSAPAAGARD